jgi:hypothetical protein
MNKEKLEVLIKLPKQQFDAVIKLINPKVTDSDLEPMFPKDWDDESRWFMPQYNYDSFRHIQIQIDEWNEKMAGC